MKRALLAVLVLSSAACSASRLKPSLRKTSIVVESRAECRAAVDCAMEGRRQAVVDALPLFLSTAAAASPAVREKVLDRAQEFVGRWTLVGEEDTGVFRRAVVRAEVVGDKLVSALDALGLVKPEGVLGRPRILVSLKETGMGAGKDVGRASDSLRRAMSARGYSVFDHSDRLNRDHQKKGTVEEAREAGRKLGAEAVLHGDARAEPVRDERLSGFSKADGVIGGTLFVGAEQLPVKARAPAVDLSPEAAAAKALEDAGALAGEALADHLSVRYRERVELGLVVYGIARPAAAARFIEAVRGLPGVVAVVYAGRWSDELRIRVFAERLGAEELAALLIERLRSFDVSVRFVDQPGRVVEAEARED